jgi:hypothetical protein
MKITGNSIQPGETLEAGDLFININRSSSGVLCVARKHENSENPILRTYVDTNNKINTVKNMRWLTEEEFKQHKIKQQTKKEENKMSNVVKTTNESTMQAAYSAVKSDGTDAAWRVAAKQAAKSVKAPVVAALQRTTLPTGVVGFAVSQLDTANGEAVLAFVLGTVMGYVPQLGTDPKFIRLARELRVLGMDRFLSKVADVMLNPLREQLVEIVKAIPFETPIA